MYMSADAFAVLLSRIGGGRKMVTYVQAWLGIVHQWPPG